MHLLIIKFVIFLLSLLGIVSADDGRFQLCEGIYTNAPLQLEKLEHSLICGDQTTETWRKIPRNQARYHLQAVLQSRGYHNAIFTEEDSSLIVQLGSVSRVLKVNVNRFERIFSKEKFWTFIGEPLTPKILDEIEAKVKAILGQNGYPCPKVLSEPNVADGSVIVAVEEGVLANFISMERSGFDALKEDAISRYDAFDVGFEFDERMLRLTEKRIGQSQVADGSFIDVRCDGRRLINLNQKLYFGEPNLLRVGVGISTELGPLIKARWNLNRLDENGSSFFINSTASFREQKIDLGATWFVSQRLERFFLAPNLELKRVDENQFTTYEINAEFLPSYKWDFQSFALLAKSGAIGGITNIAEDDATNDMSNTITYVGFLMDLYFKDHLLELWEPRPIEGPFIGATYAVTQEFSTSKFFAHHFSLNHRNYWNLFGYDPEKFVLAFRAGGRTTLLSQSNLDAKDIRPDLRSFLGGVSTLRGFGRKALPDDDVALSSLYSALEIRFENQFPLNMEPYVFSDIGFIGEGSFDINFSSPYLSPGIGVLWAPPFGLVDLSFAYGIDVARSNTRFQFYFSFGKEF